VRDVFKFIHQSAFGCEHLVSDAQLTTERIKSEFASLQTEADDLVEPLDGDFCRVHLQILNSGLLPETLCKLFMLSAVPVEHAQAAVQEKLQVLLSLCENRLLPFAVAEIRSEIAAWQQKDFCACRHSDIFRAEYAPAYRVIKKEYAKLLPLLAKIDSLNQKEALHIAIDGGAASGKTTLASLLEKVYACTVFHMDDFFLRPEQRTKERFAEVGGNVDRERFLQEVLLPLSQKRAVQYRRFDCSTFTLQDAVALHPQRIRITEGSYSCHPDLLPFYDLTVFLDIAPEKQKQRILKRNGKEWGQRFFDEWIPMENIYFEQTDIKNRCQIIINT
jgi:uridine kinase